MNPFDSIFYDSPAELAALRNQINGTFDSSSASITIMGEFAGSFASDGDIKFGRYLLSFMGNADASHSHTLVTTGDNPSWDINEDLDVPTTATSTSQGNETSSRTVPGTQTSCYTPGSAGGAAPVKSGVSMALYGVLAMVVVLISW